MDIQTIHYKTSGKVIGLCIFCIIIVLIKIFSSSDNIFSYYNWFYLLCIIGFVYQALIYEKYTLTADELLYKKRFAGILTKKKTIKLKDITNINYRPLYWSTGFSFHYDITFKNGKKEEIYKLGSFSIFNLDELVKKIKKGKEIIRKNASTYTSNIDNKQVLIDTNMVLRVLTNNGSENKVISNHTTADQIIETMNSLNWNNFNQVLLEKENGEWIEVGGSIEEDGFSVMYEEYGHQYVIDKPPLTVDHMTEILVSYYIGDNRYKYDNKFE